MKPNEEFNKTYDDTVMKYAINIPHELYRKIADVTKKGTIYNGNKAVWIREVLEMQFVEASDPPRKYSGFKAGLLKNTWVKNWFDRNNNK